MESAKLVSTTTRWSQHAIGGDSGLMIFLSLSIPVILTVLILLYHCLKYLVKSRGGRNTRTQQSATDSHSVDNCNNPTRESSRRYLSSNPGGHNSRRDQVYWTSLYSGIGICTTERSVFTPSRTKRQQTQGGVAASQGSASSNTQCADCSQVSSQGELQISKVQTTLSQQNEIWPAGYHNNTKLCSPPSYELSTIHSPDSSTPESILQNIYYPDGPPPYNQIMSDTSNITEERERACEGTEAIQ